MKDILEHEMNWVEKAITFVLQCVRRRKDVFMNIAKDIHGQSVLYMRRWYLWETPTHNYYLHRIVRSDSDHPHTHPWRWTSFILCGGYFDMAYKVVKGINGKAHLECTVEHAKPFGIYHRPATHLHKVFLFKPSWSLVKVGRYDKVNEWGFVLDDSTFVPYRRYLNLPENTPITMDRIEKQG